MYKVNFVTGVAFSAALFLTHSSAPVCAQQPSLEEQRRFAGFLDQYNLVQGLKARAAYGAGIPPYGVASLESIYAYPRQTGYAAAYNGYYGRVFEPWPYVPGDIWGYRYYDGARQSIGQRQVQTAPDRWESFPVYAPPAAPVSAPVVAPDINPSGDPGTVEPGARGVRRF